jgi:hypothetical protein
VPLWMPHTAAFATGVPPRLTWMSGKPRLEKRSMRIAQWGLTILLISPLGTALAQEQQQDSLAAAARRAQEQKKEEKKDQAKTPKVWDNDSISSVSGTVSVVGKAEEPAEQKQGEESAKKESKPVKTAEERAAILADIETAKQQLDSAKADLDILQRKYTLDQQAYYVKPDYASDKAGAAALKDEQDQIDGKQQGVADAQKKIDDLQAQLQAAGGDESSSPK